MLYFQVHVGSIGGGSSDCVVIDNFHPKWESAARKLREGKIVQLIEEKAAQVSKWSGIPVDVEFDDLALTHVRLSGRASLDLDRDDLNKPRYRSHNIHTAQEAGIVVAIATEYINWLDYGLKALSD